VKFSRGEIVRSFIGINFTREIKEDISRIQSQIRTNAVKGRFKHVDNFHITLKFLGETSNEQAQKIAKLLLDIAENHEPFQLNLDHLGCFKGRQDIRTLYIGLGGAVDKLQRLNEDIETAAETAGFKREVRPFTPHITIDQDLTLNMSFEKLKGEIDMTKTGTISVKKIELIKSEQIQNKRIYTPIYGYGIRNRQP
jgi:2'-5' RNA ligase